jgi:hypothetical protein
MRDEAGERCYNDDQVRQGVSPFNFPISNGSFSISFSCHFERSQIIRYRMIAGWRDLLSRPTGKIQAR